MGKHWLLPGMELGKGGQRGDALVHRWGQQLMSGGVAVLLLPKGGPSHPQHTHGDCCSAQTRRDVLPALHPTHAQSSP